MARGVRFKVFRRTVLRWQACVPVRRRGVCVCTCLEEELMAEAAEIEDGKDGYGRQGG